MTPSGPAPRLPGLKRRDAWDPGNAWIPCKKWAFFVTNNFPLDSGAFSHQHRRFPGRLPHTPSA